jgi:hypothetical protein
MPFWFVSRETLAEAKAGRDRIITQLEDRVAELEEDRKIMVDILGVRALDGASIYGKIKPPRIEEEIERETPLVGEDGEPKGLTQLTPPSGRARHIVRTVGARNLAQYDAELAETMRLIDLAKEEGARAAVAAVPANGNGNHS